MSISLSDRVHRYHMWLNREHTDRPMLGLLWEADIRPLNVFLESVGEGKLINAEDIDPELFLPYIEQWYQREQQISSDIIHSFSPAFGFPWCEGILGCPIKVGKDSIWAMPILGSYEDRPPITFDHENPWFLKLIEFTKAIVELADGRFPVSLPPIHSPLDMLGSIRGDQNMLLDLIVNPFSVEQILLELKELYFSIHDCLFEVIPPFQNGYSSRVKLWAPGKAITPQNEYASMISPTMYEKFALPIDLDIIARYAFHSFHQHGSAFHQIEKLLSIENLTAIQITQEYEAGGPSLEKMLPIYKKILQLKPLIIVVPNIATAEQCIERLQPEGLCLLILEASYDLDRRYDAWFESKCVKSD